MVKKSDLSPRQRKAILRLVAPKGFGDRYERDVLSDLLRLGIIDVDPVTRRVVLTEAGVRVYQDMTDGQGSPL